MGRASNRKAIHAGAARTGVRHHQSNGPQGGGHLVVCPCLSVVVPPKQKRHSPPRKTAQPRLVGRVTLSDEKRVNWRRAMVWA